MAERLDIQDTPDFFQPADGPQYHDYHGTVEEGDNRLTERMLADLMDLKDEDKLDFETATAVVEWSVNTAFTLLPASCMNKSKVEAKVVKSQLPEPEHFSIEFAQQHHHLVKRTLSQPSIPLSIAR